MVATLFGIGLIILIIKLASEFLKSPVFWIVVGVIIIAVLALVAWLGYGFWIALMN